MPIILSLETTPDNQEYPEKIVENYLPKVDGRLKDPEKIKKAQAEIDEETIKIKALDPDFGKIALICAFHLTSEFKVNKIITIENTNEAELLTEFWNRFFELKIPFSTITFNGLDFHLPYLLKRTLIKTDIKLPIDYFILKKYTLLPHFDLMQFLSFFNPRRNKSLAFYSYYFDCLTKIDETTKLTPADYCIKKCEVILQLFTKIFTRLKLNKQETAYIYDYNFEKMYQDQKGEVAV